MKFSKYRKVKILSSTLLLVLLFSVGILAQDLQQQKEAISKKLLAPTTSLRFMETDEYKKAHQRLVHDFSWIYETKEQKEILSQSKDEVVKIIKSDKNFWKVAKARYWCARNIDEVLPDLIELLKDPKFIGLEGQADLIIDERIESGDLKFYGHGWWVKDDLFRSAGRASWILSEITGQNLSWISMKSTDEQLKQYSDVWAKWYENNK